MYIEVFHLFKIIALYRRYKVEVSSDFVKQNKKFPHDHHLFWSHNKKNEKIGKASFMNSRWDVSYLEICPSYISYVEISVFCTVAWKSQTIGLEDYHTLLQIVPLQEQWLLSLSELFSPHKVIRDFKTGY